MKKWYAVEINREDNDWGTGSYDYDKAVEIAHRMDAKLIAVIDCGECIEEITDF